MLHIVQQIGGVTRLARHLGIAPQAISQWRTVPADRVLEVAAFAHWRVTPHEIRPDLYPHPDDGLPGALRGRAPARQVAGYP